MVILYLLAGFIGSLIFWFDVGLISEFLFSRRDLHVPTRGEVLLCGLGSVLGPFILVSSIILSAVIIVVYLGIKIADSDWWSRPLF